MLVSFEKCLCCELLHEAHDEGMAELRRQLEESQLRSIQQAYLLELLFGRPLARLHQAWLDEERAIAEEWARRLEGPRD